MLIRVCNVPPARTKSRQVQKLALTVQHQRRRRLAALPCQIVSAHNLRKTVHVYQAALQDGESQPVLRMLELQYVSVVQVITTVLVVQGSGKSAVMR